jgi:hypothetical protein
MKTAIRMLLVMPLLVGPLAAAAIADEAANEATARRADAFAAFGWPATCSPRTSRGGSTLDRAYVGFRDRLPTPEALLKKRELQVVV